MNVAVVQARLGSKRFPKKSMALLKGVPLVYWVNYRIKKSKYIDDIIFAIPDNQYDDQLYEYIVEIGAKVIRADEDDLVLRYSKALCNMEYDNLIRVCADNPLVSAEALDILIIEHKRLGVDYCYNHRPIDNDWPDGVGGEICTRHTFNKILKESSAADEREHLFNYIWNNKHIFSIGTFNAPEYISRPDLKLDVDYIKDLQSLEELPIELNTSLSDLNRIVPSKNL